MIGTDPAYRLRFDDRASDFLAAAGGFLAADPVVSTVVAGMADRVVADVAEGIEQPSQDWWLTVHDVSQAVVGVAMRTALSEKRPPFLLPMPDPAARALAQVLHARGEQVQELNGALPAVRTFADELARLGGGRVEVAEHTRLHELGELAPPVATAGALAKATEDDVELASDWFAAFLGDADEQAGRPRRAPEAPEAADILRRIRGGQLWFWKDDGGKPVHLVAVKPPSYGVARIGPVYTPPAERGRGWASSAVAEVSRRLQDEGARVCLFTDQANPTSNGIYAALGIRPVVDMANLTIV